MLTSTPGSYGKRPEPLVGTDEALCDKKGRILVSKKNRDRLGEKFAMALNDRGCLVAYPQHVWERMIDEIDQHPTISSGRDDYSRLLLGSADDALGFDGQGRVVIPASLRTLARIELDSNVLLVGCGNRLEIWPPNEYAKFQSDRESYNRDRRIEFENAYKRMVGGL